MWCKHRQADKQRGKGAKGTCRKGEAPEREVAELLSEEGPWNLPRHLKEGRVSAWGPLLFWDTRRQSSEQEQPSCQGPWAHSRWGSYCCPPERFQSKTESQEATARLNRRLEAKREGTEPQSFLKPPLRHWETADTGFSLFFYSATVLGTPRCHLSPTLFCWIKVFINQMTLCQIYTECLLASWDKIFVVNHLFLNKTTLCLSYD